MCGIDRYVQERLSLQYDEPPMTAERFQAHMTLFAIRLGNCMVALERQQPVGVVISAKRDTLPGARRSGVTRRSSTSKILVKVG